MVMQSLPDGQQSSEVGSTTEVRPVQEQVSMTTPQCPNMKSISTLEAKRLCIIRSISKGKNTKK